MTTLLAGYLAALVAGNEGSLDDVAYIILDECHERSVEADLLCLLVRHLLGRAANLRLVFMSATPDAELLADYFAESLPAGGVSDVLYVGGRTHQLQAQQARRSLRHGRMYRWHRTALFATAACNTLHEHDMYRDTNISHST